MGSDIVEYYDKGRVEPACCGGWTWTLGNGSGSSYKFQKSADYYIRHGYVSCPTAETDAILGETSSFNNGPKFPPIHDPSGGWDTVDLNKHVDMEVHMLALDHYQRLEGG